MSDDNAYAEALFRTAKYRPEFPANGFVNLAQAQQWAASFVRWYTLQAPTPDASVPASAPGATERDISVEVRRGAGCVTVNWPLEGAASCRAWLHDLLR